MSKNDEQKAYDKGRSAGREDSKPTGWGGTMKPSAGFNSYSQRPSSSSLGKAFDDGYQRGKKK